MRKTFFGLAVLMLTANGIVYAQQLNVAVSCGVRVADRHLG
jgi:hypothetical protein